MEAAQSRCGWVSALQISVDHLRALNATLVELQVGQQELDQAVLVHQERLRDLLQEPGCQGCAETLSRVHSLELGADFSQVQAGQKPLEQGRLLYLLPQKSLGSLGPMFPEADPLPLHRPGAHTVL